MLADSHELLSTYAALLVIDREAWVLVIFIQAIYDPQYLLAPMRERDLHVGARMPRCLMGSWGADFHVVARRANENVDVHRDVERPGRKSRLADHGPVGRTNQPQRRVDGVTAVVPQ